MHAFPHTPNCTPPSSTRPPTHTHTHKHPKIHPKTTHTLSSLSSSSDSVPSIVTAIRAAPCGSTTLPSPPRAPNTSRRPYNATAPSNGRACRAPAGLITCTPTSWRRRRARVPLVSEGSGRVRTRMLSEVARSLNGMPTTSLAPSLRYMSSGFVLRSFWGGVGRGCVCGGGEGCVSGGGEWRVLVNVKAIHVQMTHCTHKHRQKQNTHKQHPSYVPQSLPQTAHSHPYATGGGNQEHHPHAAQADDPCDE